jgi:hypothetical protein
MRLGRRRPRWHARVISLVGTIVAIRRMLSDGASWAPPKG